jgi:NADH-quinone oxidoreductase subunit D
MREKETTLYIGPQHPGITGNMMVKVKIKGDTIVSSSTHVGYLHRASEKLIEQRNWLQSFTILCRFCVPEPDPMELTYARAVEEIEGREVPERGKWIRVLVMELARLQSFMLWYGGQSGSAGLYTLGQWSVGDRNYILDLFEDLTGGRVYHMFIWPGGVRRDLPKGFKDKALRTMDYLEKRIVQYNKLLFDNVIFQKRAQGVGIIPKDKAIEWGVVGPPLRGCGIKSDVRIDEPYEVYDKLDFVVPTYEGGDVWARALVRREEVKQSISIIRQVLEKMPEGEYYNKVPNPMKWKIPAGEAYVRTESVRGEVGFYVVSDGTERPRRVHVKGAAYTHAVTVLDKILPGNNISDVSFILNSMGACPPEIER